MKNAVYFLLIVPVLSVLFSFTLLKPVKNWDVPAEYVKMKNPVRKSEASLALGKSMFNRYCAGCHGEKGKGDGSNLKNLVNVVPANLSLDDVSKEADGEHFYRIKIGRGNAHTFQKKMDDESIWSIVHYIKTFTAK